MKALGVLESKWDLIRQKVVSAERGGAKSNGGGDSGQGSGTRQVGHIYLKGKRRVYVDPR
jgi:hypothetical protein